MQVATALQTNELFDQDGVAADGWTIGDTLHRTLLYCRAVKYVHGTEVNVSEFRYFTSTYFYRNGGNSWSSVWTVINEVRGQYSVATRVA